ncbi:hypothetical protein OB919_17490 [Halobacteria archaeon AArc-curdl1]|uniref:Uncharacterized protein n=1 Tax=Natronosalvus hydrolyticus TaxID=2979988 RepID=A0AAP2ZBK6_9EURY|nr:hypothetical protein [Halobacteria archaeon AArc-curdl1]
MGRVLVGADTGGSPTGSIADYVADELAQAGHDPIVINTTHPPPNLDLRRYDGCVVVRTLPPVVSEPSPFLRANADILNRLHSGLIAIDSTNGSVEDSNRGRGAQMESNARSTRVRPAAERVDAICEALDWEPTYTLIVEDRSGELFSILWNELRYRLSKLRGDTRPRERIAARRQWAAIDDFVASFAATLEKPHP